MAQGRKQQQERAHGTKTTVHQRARKKRIRRDERAPALEKQQPPDNDPPDPPPPMRDKTQGKNLSLMQLQPLSDVHPFSETLKEWQQGIEVDCGPNWKWEDCVAAVERGPHPSAITRESIALFVDNIGYQERAGFCKVVTCDELVKTRPPQLKISPVAVMPQTDRQGRIILDLSFPVYQEFNGDVVITQASVNKTTNSTAPTIPVKEIGKVLSQLLPS